MQTGLADSNQFNSLADLIDVDKHLQAQQGDDNFLSQVYKKLTNILLNTDIESSEEYSRPPLPDNYLELYTPLQQRIIEATCLNGGKTNE